LFNDGVAYCGDHQGKEIAVIHDAIVVPVNAEDEAKQLSLLQVSWFALRRICVTSDNRAPERNCAASRIAMGIDPSGLSDEGMEEE